MTGFSPTTVSVVLNGRARRFNISRETQDLVRAVAREHHYYPNLHARSLRSRSTSLVGLTVPTLDNPFFGEMAETFERLARRDKKLPLITVTHYDPEEELEMTSYFLSQSVACVFAANLTALAEVSALCTAAGTRHVLLDCQESAQPTVTTDNAGAALALARHLLAAMATSGRGGRAFFVGGMASHAVTQLRLSGFRAALRERGLPFGEAQFVQTEFDAGRARRELQALLRGGEVGGLFLNAVPALEGLVRLFPEAADRCRQLPCAVFDYHPFMSLLADLHLTIVRQNPRQMMQEAYRLFAAGRRATARVHLIPYELLLPPGATTPPDRSSPCGPAGPAPPGAGPARSPGPPPTRTAGGGSGRAGRGRPSAGARPGAARG
jgi:DNA-binding LacI/PurR family transcriptional regulator